MPQRKRAVGGQPPVRVITRLIAEFILEAVADARRGFDGDLTQALLLMAVAHANVAHLTYDAHTAESFPPDGFPPDEDRRPVSIQAVAAAMRMPYATAHRHIGRLIEQGYCTRLERRGLVVPAAVLRSPSIQASHAGIHEKFVRMVVALDELGLALPLAGDTDKAPTAQAIHRIEIDFLLSILEIGLLSVNWDMVQLTLLAGVIALNIRDITYDADLTWQYAYADTPPPIALYQPVSVRRLSEVTSIPYETARQCVKRMLERGQIERVPGGLIVEFAWNNSAGQDEMRQVFMGRFVRAMSALARIGVDFHPPEEPALSVAG